MNEEQPSLMKFTLTYGLYASVAFIGVSFGFWAMGNYFSENTSLLNYIAASGFIYMGVSKYRDEFLSGKITYGQSLGVGTLIMVWASVVFGVYIFILNKYIAPELPQEYLSYMEKTLVAANYAPDKLETTMNVYRMFLTPFTIAFSEVLGKSILGVIFSLMLSFFLKRKLNTITE